MPSYIPPNYATLFVATCNLLNLANPHRVYYENQDAYNEREYERKIDWIGERIHALNADVLAVQEVWDEAALKAAIGRSGLRYDFVSVPGAENSPPPASPPGTPGRPGAQGTPRVGIVTRLQVDSVQSFVDFPSGFGVEVPGIGPHTRFERPPLLATVRMKHGQQVHVLTVHLKSKRPKFLQDAQGNSLEDRDDRKIGAMASLRSLLMRGAEAAALRCIVIDLLQGTNVPLVVRSEERRVGKECRSRWSPYH